jgi:hypothetical protein
LDPEDLLVIGHLARVHRFVTGVLSSIDIDLDNGHWLISNLTRILRMILIIISQPVDVI